MPLAAEGAIMCEASQPSTDLPLLCGLCKSLRRRRIPRAARRRQPRFMCEAAQPTQTRPLQTICWSPDAQSTSIEDMCVNHRGADVRMAEQFLNSSNVVPVLEQMRRE